MELVEKVSYLRSSQLVMLEEVGGRKGYYNHNAHGDVISIQDAQGETLNTYKYDIWGNPLSAVENIPNIFRYSGEYWDETTDLQYLRARWYDPSMGRFINEDTYEGRIDNPLTLNLYTYVHNNPLRYIDPSGQTLEDTISVKNKKTDAIKINISDNSVTIDVFVTIYGNAADKQLGDTGKTYRQWAIEGMVSFWSGSYSDVFGEAIEVKLNIIDLGEGAHIIEKGQKSVLINIVDEIDVSNVQYSSNIFGYRKWSKSSVGKTTLYVGDDRDASSNPYDENQFMWVAAHELGHNLGVTDSYSSKRGKKITSIFNEFGTSVQNIDIEKVLKAFQKDKQQNW